MKRAGDSSAQSTRVVQSLAFRRSALRRCGGFLAVHRTHVLQWWNSCDSEESNVCAYAVPDSQQLVSLRQFSLSHHVRTIVGSGADPRAVFVLQRTPSTRPTFSYTLSRCALRHSQDVKSSRKSKARPMLDRYQAVNLEVTCPVVLCSISPDDMRCALASQRGHVTIVNIDPRTATAAVKPRSYTTSSPASDPVALSWHPSAALFAVAARRGIVAFYDRALNPISAVLAHSDDAVPLPYLDLSR